MDRAGLMSDDPDARRSAALRPDPAAGTDWRGRLRKVFGPIVGGGDRAREVLVRPRQVLDDLHRGRGVRADLGLEVRDRPRRADPRPRDRATIIEAKREGLHPKLPVFIPFLGAYVQYTRGNPWQTARVAIAGPILGGAARVRLST